jgi:hypothetical protein
MKLKLKIPIPQDANVYAENGDKAVNLLLYEVDQLEVLEEVKVDTSNARFEAKDGQFVNKGDVIFTEGFLGHKAMISDFNGILEIKKDRCRILGQKRHFERKVNFNGSVRRVIPNKYLELICDVTALGAVFYTTYKSKLTELVYIKNKEHITQDIFRFGGANTTYFINDNLYVDELAKVIAFGARRVVVNGIFVNDLATLRREIDKMDGFCIISGFGEMIKPYYSLEDPKMNFLWGKKKLYIGDPVQVVPLRVYEHPYWGITGDFKKKNELVGNLDYNREVFEFYLKNVEKHA